jgi:DNA-binding MarR family transcriptional regulator/N-acetylglutamate synthase-like GNAT family acetyltransferase
MDHVAAVRKFNRFYTRRIGVLDEAILDSEFSLPEMRLLWEVAHQEDITASQLVERLGIDAGYASRVLRGFRQRGLVKTEASRFDGRIRHLKLTTRGRQALVPLERKSSAEVAAIIGKLSRGHQDRLVAAMRTIETLLEPQAGESWPFVLRDPRTGDFGWIIHRHGALYAQEYDWDARFEGLVAEIVARFIRDFKPKREHCWVAERDGEIVGCIFLVQRSEHVAQLRLLLVEPSARGMGVGSALVNECIRFAREARYRKIMLWTNNVLHSARHIYQRAGFKQVKQEKHHSFGHALVGQNWELSLSLGRGPGRGSQHR